MPPSNKRRTFSQSDQNKRHPQMPPSNKRRTLICSAYWKFDHNLCLTTLKCILNKCTNKETYIIMIVLYYMFYYLERRNNKVLKFHTNNFSYFEISASLF